MEQWVAALPLAGLPTAALPLGIAAVIAVVFRIWRHRAIGRLEARWTPQWREAAQAAAAAHVPEPPRDADGNPVNLASVGRRRLDAVGDGMNSAGTVMLVIAVPLAGIAVLAGHLTIGTGVVTSTGEVVLLLSPVLLVAGAVVLLVLGGVMQNAAQHAELSGLLHRAHRPEPFTPALGTLARHWQVLQAPWVDFLGLTGAFLVLCALPARLMTGAQAATISGLGTAGLIAGIVLLLAAVVVDLSMEHRTREARNRVLWRWPMPDPAGFTKQRITAQAQGQRQAQPPAQGYARDAYAYRARMNRMLPHRMRR